ncbi:TetR family transcriptional regulator [Solirubrobacter soli]|uniref:TetR family transcriptional regulator n=1 Tax=Solirubrobacter soli TaxID=363832 RepID=UPI0004122BEE|nr:TetR family transcriptional regulator [Solirubrobacter soli]
MPRPRAQLDTIALARAFAHGGLQGTSIDAVAAAAGLAKPTLYARGGSKEELFALAVDAEAERLLERLDGAARVSDVARALDEHPREGLRLLLVTGGALDRIRRAVALPEAHASALLGAAYVSLHGGPPVADVARALAPLEDAGPPAGIWTA